MWIHQPCDVHTIPPECQWATAVSHRHFTPCGCHRHTSTWTVSSPVSLSLIMSYSECTHLCAYIWMDLKSHIKKHLDFQETYPVTLPQQQEKRSESNSNGLWTPSTDSISSFQSSFPSSEGLEDILGLASQSVVLTHFGKVSSEPMAGLENSDVWSYFRWKSMIISCYAVNGMRNYALVASWKIPNPVPLLHDPLTIPKYVPKHLSSPELPRKQTLALGCLMSEMEQEGIQCLWSSLFASRRREA